MLPVGYSLIGGYIVGPKVDLSGANLNGFNLSNANLVGSTLTGVISGDIRGTPALPVGYELKYGYIVGPQVNLWGANISGPSVNLEGIDLTGSDMTLAFLENANLSKVNFSNVILKNAYLANADLTEANLTGTVLDGADLTNANFHGAMVDEADWSLLSQQQQSVAFKISSSSTSNNENSSGSVESPVEVTVKVQTRTGVEMEGFDILGIEQTRDYSKFGSGSSNVKDDLYLEVQKSSSGDFEVSVMATPSVASGALEFQIIDQKNLSNFGAKSSIVDWTIVTNESVSNSVRLAAAAPITGDKQLDAGIEVELASYTSADNVDIVMTGGLLHDTFQSDVHVTSSLVTTDGSGEAKMSFETGSRIELETVESYANIFPKNAIGAFDALQALRLAVGLDKSDGTSEWHDYIAADINKDGRVGADDALNILKFAVGLTDGPSADWVFVDKNADWSGIDRSTTTYNEGIQLSDITSDTSIDMTGILVGDVDGSYIA